MSAQPAIHQDDHDPPRQIQEGPGRRLRSARQARGLELERVAHLLHLKPALVAAIEQDDYDALPGSVFVLGYVRNYARLLNLDPDPLLEDLRRSEPPAEPPRLRTPPRPPNQVGSGHLLVRLVTLAVIAAVAGLSYLWWQNQGAFLYQETATGISVSGGLDLAAAETGEAEDSGPADAAADETAAPAEPSGRLPLADAPPAGPAPEQDPDAGETDFAPAAVPPVAMAVPAAPQPSPQPAAAAAATSEPGPAASPAPADGAPAAVETGDVVMEFSGPCWVDIRDRDRRFKIFGEMTQGDRRVLEGTPPYSVILGNASAVQITVAGKPFDLAAVARGNVARFTLDPAKLP